MSKGGCMMIAADKIPNESTLFDEELKQQLSKVFSKLTDEVYLKAIVNLEMEKDKELAGFLNVLSKLSDKIIVQYYDIEEKAEVNELETLYLPMVAMYKNDTYTGVSFHGIPGGKELNPFVYAIYNISGPGQEIDKKLINKIKKINNKVNIKICVSLTCHHCSEVVTACQRLAILNENIEAEMIDATLFEDIVKRYNIERVPMVIINDHDIYMGAKTIEEMIKIVNE